MRHLCIFLGTVALLFSAPAMANPCKKGDRVSFHANMGDATLTGIFTTFESVAKRNHSHREAVRRHKCKLIKLTGTKDWKAASKALPDAASAKPEVLAEIKRLRKTIPSHKKYVALVEEAKVAKRQYDGLVEVAVPDSKTQQYLQNVESLRGWITDLNKTTKHMAGTRTKLTGIIKANSQ